MGHLAAAKLQLHPDFVSSIEKFFGVADFRQVIVIVDVNPELYFLQLCAGRLLIFLVLRDVITELSEVDDFANRRISGGSDFDQIEVETLSSAEGVREFHDAELIAGGCKDDPDFPGTNPTVYTNLWLQIRSKLQAGDAGSEPWRRINYLRIFDVPLLAHEHFALIATADIAVMSLCSYTG